MKKALPLVTMLCIPLLVNKLYTFSGTRPTSSSQAVCVKANNSLPPWLNEDTTFQSTVEATTISARVTEKPNSVRSSKTDVCLLTYFCTRSMKSLFLITLSYYLNTLFWRYVSNLNDTGHYAGTKSYLVTEAYQVWAHNLLR